MKLSAKNPALIMTLALLLLLTLTAGPVVSPARAAEADVGMFHDDLAAYGTWVDYGNYGPVWYPTQGVTSNWRPYVDGRWVPSDEGWVFETGEPWGWATYHFGNWMPTTEYGWVWSPGSTWYPSTVAWRTSPQDAAVDTSYVGWAPIPPPDYVPEPAYYPSGGYDPSLAPVDQLSPPYWTFAQSSNFLQGFDQPYQPAYSYYNCGCMSPFNYVPLLFPATFLLNDIFFPFYARNAFFSFGPSFPFVSHVTNINVVNINNFAHRANFAHMRNVLPPGTVMNRHPFIRDAIPAQVRNGQRFQVQRAANVTQAGRHLANPGVVKPPANVPKLTKPIPKGVTPGAQPAVKGGAKGGTPPTGVAAPKGGTAPKAVTSPKGVTKPEVMTAPGRQPRAPRATTGRTTPSEVRTPTRAPSREFRAPSRGTTMPPPSTHELSPQMQRQIRQAPSRPAPSMRPSAPAPSAPRSAPSAPAPRSAPAAPTPRSAPSAPAPAPSGGGGAIHGGGHK